MYKRRSDHPYSPFKIPNIYLSENFFKELLVSDETYYSDFVCDLEFYFNGHFNVSFVLSNMSPNFDRKFEKKAWNSTFRSCITCGVLFPPTSYGNVKIRLDISLHHCNTHFKLISRSPLTGSWFYTSYDIFLQCTDSM